ncbi:hypothetical protein EPI10_020871 [Gossypium australe]|uniref:Gag-Pol polyprotein n=1 Tax=Gossypium australe TaxID=47621 RepID=A0A5B6WH97_9ROSI|nr:hypothetical protein EPI10_020871 [Gossypium australe]
MGASYIDARRREFMNLTQGDRSVAEYKAEFLRLSRYAQGMVASKYENCVHFDYCLRDNLRVLIALQREQEFAILVDKVKIAEEVKRVERQNRDQERGKNKRVSEPYSFVQKPKKRARPDGPVRRVVQQPPRGRGPARGGSGMGLGQRAPGRVANQTKARQPAMVSVAQHQEDRDAPDVIMGTFFIFDVPYTTLIDICSTHSYVASSVSENLGILVKSTSSEITVLSPLGQSIRVSKLYRNVPLVRVVLRTEDDKEVVVIGEHRDYLSNVISALVAKKLVRKGCEAFMAYVSVSIFGDFSVRDIGTVRTFSDLFPEKLRGLSQI